MILLINITLVITTNPQILCKLLLFIKINFKLKLANFIIRSFMLYIKGTKNEYYSNQQLKFFRQIYTKQL